jgi:hypothetical protein
MDNLPLLFRGENVSVSVAAAAEGERPNVGDLKWKIKALAMMDPIHVGFNSGSRTEKRINLTADLFLVFRDGTTPLRDSELLNRRGEKWFTLFSKRSIQCQCT